MEYKPPYTVSERAVSLIAEIAAAAERFSIAFIDFMLERILETIKAKGVLKDVPINVPINVPIKDRVLQLVLERPGLNRVQMGEMLSVDVKSVGRALAELGELIEHRGSKKTGGYYPVESK